MYGVEVRIFASPEVQHSLNQKHARPRNFGNTARDDVDAKLRTVDAIFPIQISIAITILNGHT